MQEVQHSGVDMNNWRWHVTEYRQPKEAKEAKRHVQQDKLAQQDKLPQQGVLVIQPWALELLLLLKTMLGNQSEDVKELVLFGNIWHKKKLMAEKRLYVNIVAQIGFLMVVQQMQKRHLRSKHLD